jgi:SAM-dependent methyltransferase
VPQRTSTRGAPDDAQHTCLGRLVDFTEPAPDDVYLDITHRRGLSGEALAARVRHMTVVDAALQPTPGLPRATVRADACALPYRDHSFTLVTMRFTLHRLSDPRQAVREMLRVCRPGGRLIIADLIRRDHATGDRDRLERLRDPAHRATPSLAQLTDLLADAGADVRRLEVFTIERPAEPWLAGAKDEKTAVQLRQALTAEVDGGPRTGARPRVIGGELWFTQSLAHVAAVPAAPGAAERGRPGDAGAEQGHTRSAVPVAGVRAAADRTGEQPLTASDNL